MRKVDARELDEHKVAISKQIDRITGIETLINPRLVNPNNFNKYVGFVMKGHRVSGLLSETSCEAGADDVAISVHQKVTATTALA
jgi:hypothetical protein